MSRSVGCRGRVGPRRLSIGGQQFGRPIAAAGRFCEVEPAELDPLVMPPVVLPVLLPVRPLVMLPLLLPAMLPLAVEPVVPVLLPVLVVVMSRIWLVALSQHLP
ncbi:MAG: hypothetical protein AB7T18_13035 [Alphaproteobacteria bacterium]